MTRTARVVGSAVLTVVLAAGAYLTADAYDAVPGFVTLAPLTPPPPPFRSDDENRPRRRQRGADRRPRCGRLSHRGRVRRRPRLRHARAAHAAATSLPI